MGKDARPSVTGRLPGRNPSHRRSNRGGGQRGRLPSNFESGGQCPCNFDEKMHIKIFVYFLFCIEIFKIKLPKSEDKLELRVGSFLVAVAALSPLKILPMPLIVPASPPPTHFLTGTQEVGFRGAS